MFEKDGMKKLYSFDHTKGKTNEALGIASNRIGVVSSVVMKADERYSTTSRVMQEIMNSDELSDAEKIYALFCLGRQREESSHRKGMHVIQIDGKMPEHLKKMLDDVSSLEDFKKFMSKVESLAKKHDGCGGDCKECEEEKDED